MNTILRRELLVGSAAAWLGSALAARSCARRELVGDEPERALVLLQLSGGNDGLNTVVPYADDAYHRARPKIGLASGEVLALSDECGLHPRLTRLHEHFQEGRLAVVEGAGYPEPNRSHFKSMDVWHAADPRGRARDEGWIGRLLGALYGTESDPSHSVHVGATVPYSLRSSVHSAACFSDAERYRWMSNAERLARLSGESVSEPLEESSLDFVRRVMADAQRSSSAVREGALRYRARVEYPRSELGDALWTAAALISAEIGCRVVSVELGGFDTHTDQVDRHAARMGQLDAALGAFLDDLQGTPAGARTVVLAFSEFGRRVQENGSGGTDHGTAGPILLAGAGVRGGLFGARPSLTELDAGDLVHTTDFRSVYAAVAEDWFGTPAAPILGGEFPRLELF